MGGVGNWSSTYVPSAAAPRDSDDIPNLNSHLEPGVRLRTTSDLAHGEVSLRSHLHHRTRRQEARNTHLDAPRGHIQNAHLGLFVRPRCEGQQGCRIVYGAPVPCTKFVPY